MQPKGQNHQPRNFTVAGSHSSRLGETEIRSKIRGTLFPLLVIVLALGIAGCGEPKLSPALESLQRLGDGSASGCVGCVLRDAIASAEPGDTIEVPEGVYLLPFGELLIDKDLTLAGAGPDKTFIEASDTPGTANHRVLRVSFGSTVTVSGMTLRHGVEDSKVARMVIFPVLPGGIVTINQEFGGGVYNQGTLHLKNVVITQNRSGSGAGVFNGGTMTLASCNISGNLADGMGGGIFNGGFLTVTDCVIEGNVANAGAGINNWADMTIARSTLSGNNSRISGGAILNTSVGSLEIYSSTFSDNNAPYGGAIRNEGNLTITNSTATGNSATTGAAIQNWGNLRVQSSTISGNHASRNGGGFDIGRPAVEAATELINTILAGNTALEGPDCDGVFDSGGNNLIGNTGACLFTPASGDLMGTPSQPADPLLAPLRDNGGPTQTQELLAGSPAIDGGGAGSALETDQRGEPRPQGQAHDIGAFER